MHLFTSALNTSAFCMKRSPEDRKRVSLLNLKQELFSFVRFDKSIKYIKFKHFTLTDYYNSKTCRVNTGDTGDLGFGDTGGFGHQSHTN